MAPSLTGHASEDASVERQALALPARLTGALTALNRTLPAEAELTRDRCAMPPVIANREVHRLLFEGVTAEVRKDNGPLRHRR